MTDQSNRQPADTGFSAPRNDAARAPTTGAQATHNHQTCSHSTTNSSTAPDFTQAAHFLTRLDEAAESWTFQTFDDNKARKAAHLARVFHGTLEQNWRELCALSAAGAGVFVTVNETNGKGRKVADVIRVRAVFQECDRPGSPEPPLDAHIVVESSPGKFHRYLLIDGGHRFDLFDGVMARMVTDYGSDPNAKDRARVLRLPGFPHQKDPATPWLVRILRESGAQPYSWDAITAAIPPLLIEKKAADVPPGKGIDNPVKVRSALAALNPDMEYLPWLQVGMALHHATAGGAEGFALWDEWSATGAAYRPGETATKWQSFGTQDGTPVTLASLFKLASAAGWRWNDATTPAPPRTAAKGAPTAVDDLRQQLGIKSLAEIIRTVYPAPQWAIDGVLPEGLTLLAGAPKVKKSWLALGISVAIAMGGKALGKIDVDQGRVLYLALEDRERRLQKRGLAILPNSHTGPEELDLVTGWKRLDDGGLDALRSYLTQYPDTRLVIVDTLAKVRPRKLPGLSDYDADYAAIAMLKSVADEYSICILVITHTRKMEAEDFLDTVVGTHGLSGAADGLLVLKRPRGANLAVLSITGRDIEEEREVALSWHQPTCSWHLTDDNAAELKLTPERRRIVEILKASPTPLSSKQIAERYHGKTLDRKTPEWGATRYNLHSMLAAGEIERDSTGGYQVADRFEKHTNTANTLTPLTLLTQLTHHTNCTCVSCVRGVLAAENTEIGNKDQILTSCVSCVSGVSEDSDFSVTADPPDLGDGYFEALAGSDPPVFATPTDLQDEVARLIDGGMTPWNAWQQVREGGHHA